MAAARARMRERDLSALLVFAQESHYYLFGYDGGGYVFFQCAVLPAEDAPVTLLCRRPDVAQARDTAGIEDVRVWLNADDANPAADLRDILVENMERVFSDRSEFRRARGAMDKILNFDTQIIFDAYIRSLVSEVESSRQRIVEHSRELQRKIEERTAELAASSRTDFLTNLMNRRAFREELRSSMARARRHGHAISLICMDIDEFKHFKRWFEEISERPAVQRGMAVGSEWSQDYSKLSEEEIARIKAILFNQRARPAPD